MSCQLRPSPTGIRLFLTTAGATITLFIESDSTLAKLAGATWNDNPLTVTNDASITFTAAAGINVLLITVVSPDVADTIQVFEDCGDDSQQKLDEYAYNPSDPARAYRIAAA